MSSTKDVEFVSFIEFDWWLHTERVSGLEVDLQTVCAPLEPPCSFGHHFGHYSDAIRWCPDPASKLQPLRDLAASKAKSLTASSQTFQPGIIVRRMKNYKGNSCTTSYTYLIMYMYNADRTRQSNSLCNPSTGRCNHSQSFVLSLEPGFPLSQAMVMPMPSSMLGVQQAMLSELRGQ